MVVSPHLDDAVLCAGASMSLARAAGVEVRLVTVFAGVPDGPFGPFARSFHDDCAFADDAEATRRAEDAAAASILDIEVEWLDLPDAIYRCGRDGPLYTSREQLFGRPHGADAIIGQVTNTLASMFRSGDVAVLPLGVGGHVDHVLVRRAGEAAAGADGEIAYYEESFYEGQFGASAAWSGVDRSNLLMAVSFDVPPGPLATKTAAVAAYESQLRMLGAGRDSPTGMAALLRTIAVERFWIRASVSIG
jgi:LmbE family N-acetylglucosaminyl deacetylase